VVSLCAGRTVIPMKLLKELALGNIQPMVRNFKKDSGYSKLLTELLYYPMMSSAAQNTWNRDTISRIVRKHSEGGITYLTLHGQIKQIRRAAPSCGATRLPLASQSPA